ncbi:DNA-processing protein DprA [Nocardia sp. NPDC049149]|uniref:DNA-processing protein DprA n=1 Tax=Nocardia sp. NPDC049149 TaxID=3364315 RepID=UPI003723A41C
MNADMRCRAWALLSRAACGPCRPVQELIAKLGVEEAAAAVVAGDVPVAVDRQVLERGSSFEVAARDLDDLYRLGGRLITPDDDEWPADRLLAFNAAYTDREFVAPVALWARGPCSLRTATDRAVAVIGTRASTEYGDRAAQQITGELAVLNWAIVSGAAFGIDSIAHRAALAGDGLTIAVLACGIDRSYPASHRQLLAQIAESGLVLSEYPLGTAPIRYQFIVRNRLTVALSNGVVAVESGLRGGTINTIGWAKRLRRPAFAVPGPITSAASAGCHHMIRAGLAQLVTSPYDIHCALHESKYI